MTPAQSILTELHAVREQLLADSGGTLAGLVARLQREQQASGRVIREAKRTRESTESNSDNNQELRPRTTPAN